MHDMARSNNVHRWSEAGGAVAHAVRRPDGAWVLRLPPEQPETWSALVEKATQDALNTFLLTLPAEQSEAHEHFLRSAGFTPARTETTWRMPVAAIPGTPSRSAHRLVSVIECDPERVAALDNAIRHDIPGTAGWSGTGDQIRESLDDPQFDPALYLVARDPHTGRLEGLVRVWNREPEPRLGCIGVISARRRTGLALLLLQGVARTLRDRGVTHITAETDHTNRASHLMALHHGGTPTETVVEWRTRGAAGPRT